MRRAARVAAVGNSVYACYALSELLSGRPKTSEQTGSESRIEEGFLDSLFTIIPSMYPEVIT
jgi:hypothetical protein